MDCQKNINTKQAAEIECQINEIFAINIPNREFKDIESFYSSNFLLSINQISSIKIEDDKLSVCKAIVTQEVLEEIKGKA